MRVGEATNERELVDALETTRKRRLQLRRGFETVWWNNIALVAGDHYAQYNPNFSRFEDHDPVWFNHDPKKPRFVVNHALTVARKELAKLTKSHPIMEIVANSDDQDDIAATEVGRAALDFAEWKFKLRKMRKNALWLMIETGLGALYVGWDYLDDRSGYMKFYIDPATNSPVFNEDRINELKEMADRGIIEPVKEEHYPLGEVEYKSFSPMQLLPDETALDFDQIKDLITTEVVDVDVLKGMYGKAARDLKPSADAKLGAVEQRMLARAGVAGGSSDVDLTVENGTLLHCWWLLPNVYRANKYLKNGKFICWTPERKVMANTDAFPYQDSRMPFVFFQHIPNSTTIWPDCVMSHIRGPNLELDKTISQVIENKDYMANPSWLIATQHKIKGNIRNVAGAVIRYRHVQGIPPPTVVEGLQMPHQVESLITALREQILDISGQSEVSRGRVPSGVRSGVAVAYLQEEDDTNIAPTIENMEEAIALMGSLTLERFSQYYTFERIIRFYRRDRVFDVRKFKGADLKNNTDVVCQAGSAMPRSKAARQQYTLELISLGVLKDPHKIEQMLEIGYGEPDDNDKAIAQANRENNLMLHGVEHGQFMGDAVGEDKFERASTAVPVKKWHNHQAHISRHTSVMMDEEFDRLTITHPEIVRLFDEHIGMHEQMLQQQQQEQMQMLLAMKGAPDGPPGQSGQAAGNGNPASSFMTQADVPDVIGGGAVRTSARQVRPQ